MANIKKTARDVSLDDFTGEIKMDIRLGFFCTIYCAHVLLFIGFHRLGINQF